MKLDEASPMSSILKLLLGSSVSPFLSLSVSNFPLLQKISSRAYHCVVPLGLTVKQG